MPTHANLIAGLEALVAEVPDAPQAPQFEPRRYTTGLSDLGVLLPQRGWEGSRWGLALLDAFAAHDAVETTSVKGQRLSLRVRGETVFGLARAIVCGDVASITPPPDGRHAVVDFCDPNLNKALHVGHLRNIAIGQALGALLERHGYRVTRQSVVNDVGLSVFEALAGQRTFHPHDTPESVQRPPDRFVGECYRKFVCTQPDAEPEVAAPDAPIGRELLARENLAQRLLRRYCAHDPEVMPHWSRLVSWAQQGQRATLARLGVKFDAQWPESRTLAACERLTRAGLERGVFIEIEDGVIVYETGQEAYPRVPLLRADGFPTEHMRALALWRELGAQAHDVACWFHVMGSEWLPSTLFRAQMLRELGCGELFDSYRSVAYEMVNIDGTKMKSGAGPTIYIEDLLGQIGEARLVRELAARGVLPAAALARGLLLGFFLAKPLHKPLEFSTDEVLHPVRNPSLPLLAALTSRPAPDASEVGNLPLGEDGALRYAVMQSQRLPRCLHQSLLETNPGRVLRGLSHLAQTCDGGSETLATALLRATLRFGLEAIGVLAPAGGSGQGSTSSSRSG